MRSASSHSRRVVWLIALGFLVSAGFGCSPPQVRNGELCRPAHRPSPVVRPDKPSTSNALTREWADLGIEGIRFSVESEDELAPGVTVDRVYPGDLPLPLLYRLSLKDNRRPGTAKQLVGRLPGRPEYCATFEPVEYKRRGSNLLVSYRRGKVNASHGTVPASGYFAATLPTDLTPGTYSIELRCLDEVDALPPMTGRFAVPAKPAKTPAAGPAPLILTEKDANRVVQVKVGQEIRIHLKDKIALWKQDGRAGGSASGMLAGARSEYLPHVEPGQSRTGPGTFVQSLVAGSPGRHAVHRRYRVWQRFNGKPSGSQGFSAVIEVAEDFASPYVRPADKDSQGWGAADNGLRMRLVVDRKTTIAGEPIPARLELECVKGHPDGSRFCRSIRRMYISLGKETRRILLSPHASLLIQEGTVYSRPVILSDLFAMRLPGRYRLSARHNLDYKPSLDSWTGRIGSPPVEIKVVPDSPEDRRALGKQDLPAPTTSRGPALPGGEISVAQAVRSAKAVAVCQAKDGGFVEIGPDGSGPVGQQFMSLQLLKGQFPEGKGPVDHVWYRVKTARGERPIAFGQQVIWLLEKKPNRWVGMKALEDTPANRKLIKSAATAPPRR